MKVYVPDYYKKFKCIADKCKHNCCIGWEIDVDEDTLNYYKTLNNNFGRRLVDSIGYDDGNAHFILTKDERCPMLNGRNLCDVISNLGESNLCQICADHPRFRNFFADRTEVGLGMCCEAACEIILFNPFTFSLSLLDNDYVEEESDTAQEEFFGKRDRVFKIATDRTKLLDDRIDLILKEFSIKIPSRSMFGWSRKLLSLEQLNPQWSALVQEYLYGDYKSKNMNQLQWELTFEQLFTYLLFRHTPDFQEKIEKGIAFSVLSYRIIKSICSNIEDKRACMSPEVLIEICRMFSSEIEYSQENVNALYMLLDS